VTFTTFVCVEPALPDRPTAKLHVTWSRPEASFPSSLASVSPTMPGHFVARSNLSSTNCVISSGSAERL
jgi:hypothetical protein